MTDIDATIIEQYADHLYRKAAARVTTFTIVGALIGAAAGAVAGGVVHVTSQPLIPSHLGYATLLVGAAALGFFGNRLGGHLAFGFRLQAQLALHQLQVERTIMRPAAAVAAVAAHLPEPQPRPVAPMPPAPVQPAPVQPAPVEAAPPVAPPVPPQVFATPPAPVPAASSPLPPLTVPPVQPAPLPVAPPPAAEPAPVAATVPTVPAYTPPPRLVEPAPTAMPPLTPPVSAGR
jgi:hypothetical protein